MFETIKKFGLAAKEVVLNQVKVATNAASSTCKIVNQYRAAGEEFALRHEKATNRIVSSLWLIGDMILAFTPLVENGFMQSLVERQPRMDLLWEGVGGRPLPPISSGLYISGGVAQWKNRFRTMCVLAGTASVLMGVDNYMQDHHWSIAPFAIGAIGSTVGALQKPLTRWFKDAKSALLRNTVGKPEQTAGLAFAFTTYPLIFTSGIDLCKTGLEGATFVASLSWSGGNSVITLFPKVFATKTDKPDISQNPGSIERLTSQSKERRLTL